MTDQPNRSRTADDTIASTSDRIPWTPIERSIYDLLCKYPDTRISSTRLAREARLHNPSSLGYHIMRIRSKLADAGIHNVIHTINRIGYMYSTTIVREEEP